MTIHVNIGEAKTRLSELVAAAKRGEDVIIQRAGEPEVRLVPVDPDRHRKAIAEQRRKWFGSLKGRMPAEGLDYVAELTFTDEEMDKFSLFPDGEAPD
jgi:prevent-host-death family protein